MKKIFCLTFILLLSAIGVFAQEEEEERTIEKSEFDVVMRAGYIKYANLAYRQKINHESFLPGNDKPGNTSKSIIEFAPTRAIRSVFESDSPTAKTRRESIILDGKRYTRSGEGPWTEEPALLKSDKENRAESPFEIIEEKIEYKSLGSQILDNRNVTVYAQTETKKMIHKTNRNVTVSFVTNKFWFGEDGGILKQEWAMENRIKSPQKTTESIYRHLRTTVWELDSNIKIEVPDIAKQF